MAKKESEAQEPQATDAAKQKAEELNVDLAKVEPTGSQGQVKVGDVEAASEEEAAEEEQRFVLVPNPKLGVALFEAPDGRQFFRDAGTSQRAAQTVSEGEYAERSGYRINGLQALVKDGA